MRNPRQVRGLWLVPLVCFRAFGATPPITGVVLAYLLGQLCALIPVTGGIGGTEAGLIGALVLYGTATATVSVLAYRPLLLEIPATLAGWGFIALKRALRDEATAPIPCADDLPVASGAVL